mmetsp:Transcript_52725/g.83679  ORF Transcript_52725/g.83679 Transcript_52725/m.83679 type:complete len:254 (+) Transcript_52725:341-1102(+)
MLRFGGPSISIAVTGSRPPPSSTTTASTLTGSSRRSPTSEPESDAWSSNLLVVSSPASLGAIVDTSSCVSVLAGGTTRAADDDAPGELMDEELAPPVSLPSFPAVPFSSPLSLQSLEFFMLPRPQSSSANNAVVASAVRASTFSSNACPPGNVKPTCMVYSVAGCKLETSCSTRAPQAMLDSLSSRFPNTSLYGPPRTETVKSRGPRPTRTTFLELLGIFVEARGARKPNFKLLSLASNKVTSKILTSCSCGS